MCSASNGDRWDSLLGSIFTLMYTNTVDFGGDVDPEMLATHLAECLRGLKARDVNIEANRVTFIGGIFRFVGRWNVLVPFGFGDLTVDLYARQVLYRLSFGSS